MAEARQVYFGKDTPLTEDQIKEITSGPLMKIETDILWQEQLDRELMPSELDFIFEVARGWTTRRKVKQLARLMDITDKRLKSILKRQ